MAQVREGTIPYKGYQTYYKIVGEESSDKLPLLMLHGGPGSAHFYLEPYEAMADKYGRQLIFYDQIGCGNSMIPHQSDDFWNVELWMEELDVVRKALDLRECHLLGHSWGGMLAMEYMLKGTEGIASMIIAASPASMKLWLSEALRLRSLLPEEMEKALRQADVTGDYTSETVILANNEYYRRHVIESIPWPKCVQETFDKTGECYEVMQGVAEFVVTGKMKDWDITDQLHRIQVPTLLLSGTDDEATPLIVKQIYDRIPNAEWALIPFGTHMGHVAQPEPYMNAVETFIMKFDDKKEKEGCV